MKKHKNLNITVLVDSNIIPPTDPDFLNMPDEPVTEYHVIEALRNLGHKISILGAVQSVEEMMADIKRQNPDLIFNLTEQLGGDRRFDKSIAAVLEISQIPFTGTGSTGLLLSRDKRLCKQLLGLHKIHVPKFVFLPKNKAIRRPAALGFPLVIKPAFEDGSEGISNASVVENEDAFNKRVKFVHDGWHQAVIAEEYVEGRELYVGILGNKKLSVLPTRECKFNAKKGPCLATYRVKWNKKYRNKWNIEFGFAEIEKPLALKIQRVCKKVFRILQLRDYARIDVRLTPDGKVFILEANANPDLAYGEEVAEAAEKQGISYEDFIQQIIDIGLKRYK
ncbi:MAG: ATP-grasp domain-containing protein [Phycisphaerae bacterium]|nr:ATP-grasp domain-containing protein [Phycisphaerae bacterium]